MPPAKSGIADYSEALLGELGKLATVETFAATSLTFDPGKYEAILYQVGNNPYHDFVYETALRHPGFVVMHEANLHHLIAHLTIKRGNWDGYVEECEFDGGAKARQFAERVRRKEVGPDYDGVPMLRRLLAASKGVIAHSHFVADACRKAGFQGPVAVIPHGTWLPEQGLSVNRYATREELGIDEATPLVGAFGHIKPYKRIEESLRAFRRVVKLEPRAKMILVGEPHPDFRVDHLIRTFDLGAHVRIIGYTDIERFEAYMQACDIVLNLRFPTVGETSGSLQRAMGMGRATIVSDVGSFAELPNDTCLKVAPGKGEQDLIFEYLNLLVSRPELARAMGNRAREWVAAECSWPKAAARYLEFMGDPAAEEPNMENRLLTRAARNPATTEERHIGIEAVTTWVAPESRSYAEAHKSRFVHTLEITPPGDASKSILEMGAYMQITAALKYKLGYGAVRGCYYGPLGRIDHKSITSDSGETFECEIDHFDAEKDVFPYGDASFDTVLCCELLEHLFSDPMHMMSEINRILKPGGHLVLTTPNVGSLRSIAAILLGYHPSFFPAYIRPRKEDEEPEARHNREYVPMEIQHLLTNSGFETIRIETGEFLDEPHPEFAWVRHLLERYNLGYDRRGDGIYAVGRKSGPVKERWPSWLYS